MNTPIGVGPHALPWPQDPRLDKELLRNGDTRNVIDKYRYWTVDAIKADLDLQRFTLEVAVENVGRDFNMGTIVRNANAFNVHTLHIIGRKQWNKRGAMVTDAYMNIRYHRDVGSFIVDRKKAGKSIIAIDIVPDSIPISDVVLPKESVLVFGAEGPGVSEELLSQADRVAHIEQFGSTRSVNVGVASGIAMYIWLQQQQLTR